MKLGWIDFSKSERNKIITVLEMLSESGTLDELGIAPIRDGFSNVFFPGTSTIQTRAKYFFIVPYALRQLEHSNKNYEDTIKKLGEIEKNCGKAFLAENNSEGGIIGKRSLQSGGWVKRTPADIYWAGLKRYGIFIGGSMSLTEYVNIMCGMKANKNAVRSLRKTGDDESECDDRDAGDIHISRFWNMPLYFEKWFDSLSIHLTPDEGTFLKSQIIKNCKNSMLAYILENNMTEFVYCDSFQDMSGIIDRFPEDIIKKFRLAVSFSEFIFFIRTIYNVIISNGMNEQANIEFERQKIQSKCIANIDFELIMRSLNVISNISLRKFLIDAQVFIRAGDMESLKKCVIKREVQLKGIGRAKTTHPGTFDTEQWIGGKGLDYRFYNTRTIVRDIFESEGLIDAES